MARLAEFVLMQAEVLARAGELEMSVQLLNLIRERSLGVVDAAGNEMPDKSSSSCSAQMTFKMPRNCKKPSSWSAG